AVPDDIDGEVRGDPPSIGADEYSAAPLQPLAGTYTIGGDPGDDFANPTEAVDAMSANGVGGAVVFQIDPGTYTGQLEIPAISGTSATNTFTFESASGVASDVILTFAATTAADNYVLRLRNAAHLRLRNLTVAATGTTYSRAIHGQNGLQDLLIEGCRLTSSATSTNSFSAGIYLEPTLSESVRIHDSYFSGGAYALYYSNGSGAVSGTEFTDNVVEDSYLGVYLDDLTDVLVTGNRITNPARANAQIALYLNNCDAPAASPSLVANNFLTATSGNRVLFAANSDNLRLYHNSLNQRGAGPALYLGSNPDVEVKNNILRATTGYAADVTNNAGLDMNYNDLYTTGTYLARYSGAPLTDLAAWQSASGQGANSLSFAPQYLS
ncbi:right-handed parallel beta-helix repeat-containing protein, partial [Neolewinella aquimaris]|uniref:right-handed parallel beta-helix repeat-containing protein n=1 Tax=Neolewinella aquimaris TaxID=1835722 RepID=UPI00160AF9FC